MVAMPLAHVSWAIADNAGRPACDAFFIDVFGAQTAYEMLMTPEAEAMGLDREERLMLIGDAMVIPIAPAGRGLSPDSPTGRMLRRAATPDRWIGIALKVADLAAADAWFRARGFDPVYDPGMEAHYFLIGRKQAMGMRLEILAHPLPGDPRGDPAWRPAPNPLGIAGLQALGMAVPSLGEARALFSARLDWPEVAPGAFLVGDCVIEAAADDGEPGLRSLTFRVNDLAAARRCLAAKGLPLIERAGCIAIDPARAHGRTIWLTEAAPAGYPPPGSRMSEPALFR